MYLFINLEFFIFYISKSKSAGWVLIAYCLQVAVWVDLDLKYLVWNVLNVATAYLEKASTSLHLHCTQTHFDPLKQWQTKCLLIAIWSELNLRFSLSDTNYRIQVPCEGHMQENRISEFCHWHRLCHRQPLTHTHTHPQTCKNTLSNMQTCSQAHS